MLISSKTSTLFYGFLESIFNHRGERTCSSVEDVQFYGCTPSVHGTVFGTVEGCNQLIVDRQIHFLSSLGVSLSAKHNRTPVPPLDVTTPRDSFCLFAWNHRELANSPSLFM